jgi:hypothetical protein
LHELVHTAQYERLGGIVAFLRKYLSECATSGYRAAPLEEEAIAVAQRIQSSSRKIDPVPIIRVKASRANDGRKETDELDKNSNRRRLD